MSVFSILLYLFIPLLFLLVNKKFLSIYELNLVH